MIMPNFLIVATGGMEIPFTEVRERVGADGDKFGDHKLKMLIF